MLEYYDKHTGADGIILIGGKSDFLQKIELPVVQINPSNGTEGALVVTTPLHDVLKQALAYTIEKGVRSFGFIADPLTSTKLQIFRTVLEELGMQEEESRIVVTEERFEVGGYGAMACRVPSEAATV